MENDNWWKISLVIGLVQMILFGYLNFIFVNIDWFFSFGFIVMAFMALLFISIILMALKKKIGYEIGIFFSLLGIMFGSIMIFVSFLFQFIGLIYEGTPKLLLFAIGVEPIVFLLFIVIPIALLYAINKTTHIF